uniref:serpin B3-like n=1 Tax=Podarcis muralis TaxID=64176 RepID=UPI0010A0C17E|nr:serpin B3-like [Podarcis muralis]
MTSLSEANAKFATDFFHLLRKEHPCGNILFSPVNLSTALHLLLYGSRHDTKAEIEKVLHHLSKAKEHARSGTGSDSETATKIDHFGSKLSIDLSNFSNARTAAREAGCEAEEGASSPGEDERRADGKLELSVAETTGELDSEEVSPSYFIPWRKHLQGMEEAEYLVQEQSSPKGKVSRNPSTSRENLEEPVNENMAAAEAGLHTSSHAASDNISALLSEFRRTVKHADDNVQAFKESFGIFKECCDKVCTSMSNLQAVLEALVTILRE